jgi:tRNA (guanine37-N1)-methyltransferase
MRIDILTLFPEMFAGPLEHSMMWKAREYGQLDLHLHNIRDYALDKHRSVDDTPYGGGGGMLLRVDVMAEAVRSVRDGAPDVPVIILSPQGRLFSHEVAAELASHERLILVCGHYEGFDDRIRTLLATDEISIGDYVLTGGELAAMVIIDAIVRQIPGVLGAEGAHERDSHADGLLEGPHYTRPQIYQSYEVPEILQQGNHARIDQWRREQSLRRTWKNRPDLLLKAPLTEEDRYTLAKLAEEEINS